MEEKPKKRSRIRIILGLKYYQLKRIKDEYITENHAYMVYSPILTSGKNNEV